MTDEILATVLETLGEHYRAPLTAPAMRAYSMALEELTDEELQRAAKLALKQSKFMPTAAELLGFAGKAKNLVADCAMAWEAVRGAVRMHDYTVASIDFGPLVNTVLRCMGSWEWLCDQKTDDMVWRGKDFERYYMAFAQGDPRALRPEALIGWGQGRVGCDDVRVSIAGVAPPLLIAAPSTGIDDTVRKLADQLSRRMGERNDDDEF